jgi:hypothetical protein
MHPATLPPVLRSFAVAFLSLSIVLIGTIAPGTVSAADPLDEIPGLPLPGSVVTGRLGGPIYDRVYQVDVPAQRVLLLSLTGSVGTDFDIYLFDATATSVYAKTGLVAKSTGPTSSEVLAYPSVGGGTFFIDLSGFSDIEGDYRLTVKIGADSTPPQVSLVLDGGAPATFDPDVSVTVVATDDLSGVDSTQFSLDGTTWLPFHPYTPSVAWHFDGDDGPRTLWVRVSDRRGNVSAPTHASIVLDRVLPFVVARSPGPGAVIAAARPVFSVTFSEPIRPGSWLSFGLILQDGGGTPIFGTYAWDPATSTGTFTAGSDLQIGASYVVSLGSIVDLAGNPVASPGSWTVRPLAAPGITLAAKPRVAARGATVRLTGSVDDSPGGAFLLERLGANGTWSVVEPLLPDAGGAFFSEQVVGQNTSFRVAYSGNEVSAPTTSPGVRILVRRSVSLAGPGPAVVRSAAVGKPITVTAVLGPTGPAVPVTLTLSRYDAAKRTYRVVARLTQTSSDGRTSFRWRPSTAGRYIVQLSTAATAAYAGGQSSSYRWIVR